MQADVHLTRKKLQGSGLKVPRLAGIKLQKKLLNKKNMDAWKTARLFALLQMSVADAYIACLKAKMIHFFWRPYTAILQGDNDGNPNTVADPLWQVLVAPIPPIADHPSAHPAAGGAAAELVKQFFEKDEFFVLGKEFQ